MQYLKMSTFVAINITNFNFKSLLHDDFADNKHEHVSHLHFFLPLRASEKDVLLCGDKISSFNFPLITIPFPDMIIHPYDARLPGNLM